MGCFIKLFRSLLYAPGHRNDLIEAAAQSPADALILDLEDQVPADLKPHARLIVARTVEKLGNRVIMYARINAVDSGVARDDLATIAVPGLAGVRIPKIESADAVRRADELLAEAEQANGLDAGSVAISLGLESAHAVRMAYELCLASRRIVSAGPGLGHGGDLQQDIGYLPSSSGIETLYIRSKVVLDVRAAGIPIPLDGGYGSYRSYDASVDEAGLIRSATVGRQLGYRAKTCFHPAQVEHVNRIFAADEVTA